MMGAQFNDSAIHKRSRNKELPRAIKTFEYENRKCEVKCCDHWENNSISLSGKSCGYTRVPGAFSDRVMPDIDYFTDEPVVQCDASVVKKKIYILVHKKDS